MYKDKTFLAIVPARAGSKRLVNKNSLELNGKPLISYSLEAAKKSKFIDNTIVSTDSKELLEMAKKMKFEVPFLRPKYLSSDTASLVDVTIHAVNSLKDLNKEYDYIILLQPTSPFRKAEHIDESICLMDEKKAEAIISVCETAHSPLWTNTLGQDNSMSDFLDKSIINKQSQELEKFYSLNGAIYIIKTDTLMREKKFFLDKEIYAYIMDKKSSLDIDDEYDFLYAETIINNIGEIK